ncbi:glycerol kinase GlpK [Uliginosibacterium sp. H3]|uniref:Glycerol kinase n=1 Tax=Uliginosibacterium silvisoli TaxID=3114758 RepID=A0ABU6JZN4_9RHOO|nr:glycerol kinase GlpK [Uliginosibacterium sp. H3]
MSFLLALDQGTTSSRAIVFDARCHIVAVAQRELPQIYPQPGWVEHDPMEIWSGQLATVYEVLAKAGLAAQDIAAIGITNQRETTVLWERSTGRPLCNAIVWQDRRTAALCTQLREAGHEAAFRERTGLILDPYFSGTKLRWLLDSIPGAQARAEAGELAFGTVDSWLVWQLTGGRLHVSDVTNASRTLLYNIHTSAWDEELLTRLRIPRALLPEVCNSSELIGETDAAVFGAPIRIAGIAGDQQAALFGQSCVASGMAKNTYGTGCFALSHTGGVACSSNNGLITTRAAQLQGADASYALEGSVFVGGAVVQWLRDGLGVIRSAAEIEALASLVPDAAGVSFIPAFAGLGAPYWNPEARAAIVGLTRGSSVAHIARAALEAIAFQSAELIEAMQADSAQLLGELRVDGGASANNLLMQMQADLLGVPVVRPVVQETTALGAACLAGLAVGLWRGADELATLWQRERVFEPLMSRDEAQRRLGDWRAAVQRVM